MSELNKTDLKAIFKAGAVPTEAQFASLIESQINTVETASLNETGSTQLVPASGFFNLRSTQPFIGLVTTNPTTGSGMSMHAGFSSDLGFRPLPNSPFIKTNGGFDIFMDNGDGSNNSQFRIFKDTALPGIPPGTELLKLNEVGGLSITGSLTSSGDINITGSITCSFISASGTIIADTFQSSTTTLSVNDSLNVVGNITASGNISASGNITSSNIHIVDEHPKVNLRPNTANGDPQVTFKNSLGEMRGQIRVGITSNTSSFMSIGADTTDPSNPTTSMEKQLYLSASGDVGIGFMDPSEKLMVSGNLKVTDEHPKLFIQSNAASGDPTLQFKSGDGSTMATIRCDVTNNIMNQLSIGSGTNETHLVLDANGKIGIGLNTPGEQLTVTGNISSSGTLTAEDIVVADDLSLTSDSSIFNMGAGNDFSITHDGTTGATIRATPLTLTSVGTATLNATGTVTLSAVADIILDTGQDIVLDAAGGNIEFKDSGTTQLTLDMDGTAGAQVIQLGVNGDDLVFKQFDGTTVFTIGNDSIAYVEEDLKVGDDIWLSSNGGKISFGSSFDNVSLTHVLDTGLLLGGTKKLQFNDASQFIHAPSATVLDIAATDEIELTATLIDVVGNLDVSGTTDLNGPLTVDGSNISLDSTATLNIDNSNTSNGITIGTATSGVPISVGHTTSETTVNDNLTVTGTTTFTGAQVGQKLTIKNLTATDETLTAAESGKLCLFSDADGAIVTLPDSGDGSLVGVYYDFYVSVAASSNVHRINVADTTNEDIEGYLHVIDGDNAAAQATVANRALNSDGFDTIAMNGTTTGTVGTNFRITNIAADRWYVTGHLIATGTPSTPFVAS